MSHENIAQRDAKFSHVPLRRSSTHRKQVETASIFPKRIWPLIWCRPILFLYSITITA